MNILILHGSSDLYGASNVLLNVIKVLLNNGDKPIVVLSESGPLSEKLINQNVEVHIIRLGILRRKYFSPLGLMNRIAVMKTAGTLLRKLCEEKKIEVIYSHTSAVLIGALIAKKLKKRHIWQILEITTKPLFFVRAMAWLLNNYSETIITASDAVKNHWKKWVDEDKLKTIYNGLDCSPYEDRTGNLRQELNMPSTCVLIGMIGRVHFWKGQDYFIKIAASLLKLNPNIRFIMAGDAFPGYEYLYAQNQKLIDDEKINDKIINLGYREDVLNIMNSLDIFISPSTQPDPFPTVILEAMAANKPIIATAHGGALEMLKNNISGLLIPLNNPDEAAKIILPLTLLEQRRLEMGDKGGERIRTLFSYTAFANSVVQTFK